MPIFKKYAVALILLCASINAFASCGAAFCSLNTQWIHDSTSIEPGWRFDTRYEWIDQDQPQHGTDDVSVGEIPRHHDEVRTINRNTLFSLEYANADGWAVSVIAPYINRAHEHIHNHKGAKITETWNFSDWGDVQVLGNYAIENSSTGIIAGIKLPTGKTDVKNSDGEEAERTLQPGTGTTDALFGAYYNHASVKSPHSWFAQGLWQGAQDEYHHFRPGDKTSLDVGYNYAINSKWGFSLQANGLIKKKDSGDEAEREDSGGKYVFLSSGVGYLVIPQVKIYGFIQEPLYQNVNGVQLTADYSLVSGFSWHF